MAGDTIIPRRSAGDGEREGGGRERHSRRGGVECTDVGTMEGVVGYTRGVLDEMSRFYD